MTCTCIEKLAAAIRADKAKYPHADGAMLLGRIADALSPPPSVPELAGWRAKCDITEYDHGWYVDTGWRGPRPLLFLGKEGHWGAAEDVAYFPTRAAAVAALNAASEPPGCEDDKPATDNVNTRPHSVVVKVEPVPTAAAVVADGKAGGGQPATGIAAQARANSLADRLMGENKNLRDWMRRAIAEEIQIVNDTAEQAGYERGKAEFVGTTTFDLLMKAGESLQRDVAKATQPAAPADAKEVEDARWRKEGPAL